MCKARSVDVEFRLYIIGGNDVHWLTTKRQLQATFGKRSSEGLRGAVVQWESLIVRSIQLITLSGNNPSDLPIMLAFNWSFVTHPLRNRALPVQYSSSRGGYQSISIILEVRLEAEAQ
jgi:hypothetical protein